MFTDIFGNYIKVEITRKGAESDRIMYTTSDIYQNPDSYLSEEQHGMADMEYTGDGRIVFPFKRNASTSWMYRTEYNRLIRKQRMVIE